VNESAQVNCTKWCRYGTYSTNFRMLTESIVIVTTACGSRGFLVMV